MQIFRLVLLSLAVAVIANAHSYGPADGYVGNPNSCVSCHSQYAVNSGSAMISLIGLSENGYTAGRTYHLTLTVSQQGQSRWGFELSPVLTANTGTRGGTLVVTDTANTQLSAGSGTSPQYIKQTTNGTRNGTVNGPVNFTFDWVAPASGAGNVTFYYAVNAANGNGSSSGDYIYTRTLTIQEASNAVQEPSLASPKSYAIASVYPNPFNPSTTVRVNAPISGKVDVAVYNLSGQLVQNLYSGYLSAGQRNFTLSGHHLASGVYLVRVSGAGYHSAMKVTLLK